MRGSRSHEFGKVHDFGKTHDFGSETPAPGGAASCGAPAPRTAGGYSGAMSTPLMAFSPEMAGAARGLAAAPEMPSTPGETPGPAPT